MVHALFNHLNDRGFSSLSYSTRSSAFRAARNACKAALDSPIFQAYEGPDFGIHPASKADWLDADRWTYELRGSILDAALAKRGPARR